MERLAVHPAKSVAQSPLASEPSESRGPEPPRHTAVVAFGGNAIIRTGQQGTIAEQTRTLAEMARQVAAMLEVGWSVVVTHGNGPHVGNILLQQDAGAAEVPAMPLDVCGAMSQGQIGYLFQQTLEREFARRRIHRTVATLLTRCVVDPADRAFRDPSKPVGPFYDEQTAARLRSERGWILQPDAGRGYRRVVPSPVPRQIVEHEAIRQLVTAGMVVITCGGGGIPVVATENGAYRGVEAVIDKDLAASLLAGVLGASTLVLLTQVAEVRTHFGTPHEQKLSEVTVAELEALNAQGHFAPGSMGPKVQAAVEFLRAGGELVIVTSPALLLPALDGRAGTRVRPAARTQATGARA